LFSPAEDLREDYFALIDEVKNTRRPFKDLAEIINAWNSKTTGITEENFKIEIQNPLNAESTITLIDMDKMRETFGETSINVIRQITAYAFIFELVEYLSKAWRQIPGLYNQTSD